MFEKWFPACARFGMSEEQFWRSNPRIISTWEKVWRDKQNWNNEMAHMFTGNYVLSALCVAMNAVNGGKAKYIEKPVKLFESTEEDKRKEKQRAINAFMGWANSRKSQYNRKGG